MDTLVEVAMTFVEGNMKVFKKGFLATKLQAIYLAWPHLYKKKMYVHIFIFIRNSIVTGKTQKDTKKANNNGNFTLPS